MRTAFLVSAALLACACEAKFDASGVNGSAANEIGSAEGKAEEGKIALKAPGFDFSIAIPKSIAESARTDHDSQLLYPGSAINGVYIAAGDAKSSSGEVELRFATPDPPQKVAAWYRDPARAPHFAVGEAQRQGNEISLSGQEKGDGQSFKLRLAPASGGGTDGRLTVRDRS